MTTRKQVELDSRIDEVSRLSDEVDAFAQAQGWPREVAFAFQLSLEEWVSNIIKYGHRNEPGHPISVELWEEDGRFLAQVSDESPPFDPVAAPLPPDLHAQAEARPIGGLGVYLIRQMMDDLTYGQRNGRNHLRMTKSGGGPQW